jgi:hypothetical protein
MENGLEAMLVHDSKANKAAASLDVAVGHLTTQSTVAAAVIKFCHKMGTPKGRYNHYTKQDILLIASCTYQAPWKGKKGNIFTAV